MTEQKLKKKKKIEFKSIVLEKKKFRFFWEKEEGEKKTAIFPVVRIEPEILEMLEMYPKLNKSKLIRKLLLTFLEQCPVSDMKKIYEKWKAHQAGKEKLRRLISEEKLFRETAKLIIRSGHFIDQAEDKVLKSRMSRMDDIAIIGTKTTLEFRKKRAKEAMIVLEGMAKNAGMDIEAIIEREYNVPIECSKCGKESPMKKMFHDWHTKKWYCIPCINEKKHEDKYQKHLEKKG